MYQSFPQKHFNSSNCAMPYIKENSYAAPPILPEKEKCEKQEEKEIQQEEKENCCNEHTNIMNPFSDIFGDIELDDIIIIGLILLLLFEGSNDWLVIILLGVVLFV